MPLNEFSINMYKGVCVRYVHVLAVGIQFLRGSLKIGDTFHQLSIQQRKQRKSDKAGIFNFLTHPLCLPFSIFILHVQCALRIGAHIIAWISANFLSMQRFAKNESESDSERVRRMNEQWREQIKSFMNWLLKHLHQFMPALWKCSMFNWGCKQPQIHHNFTQDALALQHLPKTQVTLITSLLKRIRAVVMFNLFQRVD